jgi:hypothetical protein
VTTLNADAPLAKGRRDKLTGAGSYPHCAHQATRIEVMPASFPHHAKKACSVCGRFVRWLPKPSNVEARRERAARIAKLGICAHLTSLERKFIGSVAPLRKHSPTQIAIIDRMAGTYLVARA